MRRRALCYLCGLPGADTREHVIPYCFFTSPRPANLLTLPAHKKCNSKYAISDEYSRNILAWLGMDRSKIAQELWDGQISRAFKRSAPLRNHIHSSLVERVDKFSVGGIYLGSAPGMRLDTRRFYPTIEKIVRGLHRHNSGSVLPNDAKFGRWLLQEPMAGTRRAMFERASPIWGYPDVFAARFFLFTKEGSVVGTWYWLRFYNKTSIECYVRFSAVAPPIGFPVNASFSGSLPADVLEASSAS